MQRHAWVIGLKREKMEEYKRLHAAVWPDVLDIMRARGIRNYSIYLREVPDGNLFLFSYLEYAGDDFTSDMGRMAAEPRVQAWWDLCKPCQQPLANRAEGEWWSDLEEVFHCE